MLKVGELRKILKNLSDDDNVYLFLREPNIIKYDDGDDVSYHMSKGWVFEIDEVNTYYSSGIELVFSDYRR